MKNQKNKLKDVIYSQPANSIEEILKKIATKCDVSLITVYRWMREPQSVKTVYRPLIAKSLKVKISELFD